MRHYATWPARKLRGIKLATSHNAALCVNGPEGSPQTPLGLTQGGELRRLKAKAFKSIPTHLGNLGWAASAHANSAWSSVSPTPGKTLYQRGFVPSQCLRPPSQISPMLAVSSLFRCAPQA